MTSKLPDILDAIPHDGVGLDEIAERANDVLDSRHVVVRDGRASERIDPRTIRFYQTLGIVPKPAYEGRKALYGREHLVRVVVAKLLQSEGHSLAQIQAALPARATDDLVAALLAVGADAGEANEAAARSPELSSSSASSAAFPSSRPFARPTPHARAPQASARIAPQASSPTQLVSFHIAEGVTVLIDPTVIPDPNQLARLFARVTIAADVHTRKPRGGKEAAAAASPVLKAVVDRRDDTRAPREDRKNDSRKDHRNHGGKH
jgi:DNA-binding transcriptional MerR regulator